MKIQRLIGIIMILLNKEKVTAKELAEEFEVSVRTIQRDMEAISMAGIPIVSYQGIDGGYGIMNNYKIRSNYFTNGEYKLLLNALQGVYTAYDEPKMKNIINKLAAVQSGKQEEYLETVIMDFTPWDHSESKKKKLDLIKKAIEENQVMKMDYIDLNGVSSSRTIEPLTLILKVNTWYLYAYCQLRQDYRLFKLSRVRNIQLIAQWFIKKNHKQYSGVNKYKRNQNDVQLKLKFDQRAWNRLDDYFDSDHMEYKEDGYIYVTVQYPEDEWVYSMLLSFGDWVEVLEPIHVQELIKNRAMKIQKKYN